MTAGVLSQSVVIQAKGLSKARVSNFLRRRNLVLENLSLEVKAGETFGLLGPNGAGKTTAVKLLLGLMRPDQGEANVLGLRAGDRAALKEIGFLPENPYFYSHLTGREFLTFIGQLFDISKNDLKEKVASLLKLVSMETSADKPMYRYSKGMLQRLGVAQCLINDPKVIFLDEPMSGLDPIGRRDVREILRSLKEKGTTIFFNSHLLPDVSDICDRIGVLNKGKLVAEDEIKNITGGGGYHDLEEYFLAKVEAAP